MPTDNYNLPTPNGSDSFKAHRDLKSLAESVDRVVKQEFDRFSGQLSDIGINVKKFGAVGDGITDDTTAFQAAVDAMRDGDTLLIPFGRFLFRTLTFSKSINVLCYGTIVGKAPIGTKPTKSSLIAAGTSAARLALLEGYYQAKVIATPAISLTGNFKLENALIKGSITFNCKAELLNVSLHGSNINAPQFGNVYAPNVIISDAPSAGMYAECGGQIKSPDAIVVYSGTRGMMAYCGGIINAPRAKVLNNLSQGVFILQNGTVVCTEAEISSNGSIGVNTNYGGSADVSGSTISNNNGAGIGCESNGSVFAQNATISNNNGVGIATFYGGFIQGTGTTITSNASYAAYANGDGTIDVINATIANNNNAGGVILRAIGKGQIRSEPPGGSGKTNLLSTQYEPQYNSVGFGTAYIGQYSQNNALVFTPGVSLGAPLDLVITNGLITVGSQSSYRIDTEGSAALDDLDGILGGVAGQIIYLQTKSNLRDVNVRHNRPSNGSLLLLDAATDFALDTIRDLIVLKKSYGDGTWEEVSRTNIS